MSLDELLRNVTEQAHGFPNVTNEEKLCRDYWQGYITYDQYLKQLNELRRHTTSYSIKKG